MSRRLHNRGGYREGAGRPKKAAKHRERHTLTLNPATVEKLKAWAAEQYRVMADGTQCKGISLSEAVERLVSQNLPGLIPEAEDCAASLSQALALLDSDAPALTVEQKLMVEAFDNALKRRGQGKGLLDVEWFESYQGLAKWATDRQARLNFNRIKRELQRAGLYSKEISKGDLIFRRQAPALLADDDGLLPGLVEAPEIHG